MVALGQENNRPYPPPSNVVSVLQRLRSRNLPERIDAEYLRDASIPEGTIGRTLFALRFLGIISEEGEPTQALQSIHTSTDEEYQAILGGLVREAYKEVFNVLDPAEDSQDRIINVFRRYTPASQRNRMAVFFLGMCREAAIPTLDVPRQRTMTGGRPVTRPSSARATRAPEVAPPKPRYSSDVAPALEGLIKSLPSPGTPLSLERRQQWLRMAEATLAFVYPDEAEVPLSAPVEEETEEVD
ncbi:MAG: DUF5343 domain-containing protein [Dehalococcoidia bacterium]|jgi:hypothetical protein